MESVKLYRVAKGGHEPMIALDAGGWVLVYTYSGKLVTFYQKEDGIEYVTKRYLRLKWTVSEVE
ncbi:hypothetical protein D5085_04130 [Ectothiorhodospiraceae bacterium BW-2]|nr:hypothetical protein D5085_04130 [Ectothiorhodospiraceae bacterium BW-2]